MQTLKIVFVIVIISICFISCEKEAGLGGKTTLILKPQHHSTPIPNQATHPDSAFIKFNASDFPGDNAAAFDHIVVGNTGEDFVKVSGLKEGKYYIFMAGFDTSINQRVNGGIPYEITQEGGEITLIVFVTEVH